MHACRGKFDLLRLEEVIEARLVDELAGLGCRTLDLERDHARAHLGPWQEVDGPPHPHRPPASNAHGVACIGSASACGRARAAARLDPTRLVPTRFDPRRGRRRSRRVRGRLRHGRLGRQAQVLGVDPLVWPMGVPVMRARGGPRAHAIWSRGWLACDAVPHRGRSRRPTRVQSGRGASFACNPVRAFGVEPLPMGVPEPTNPRTRPLGLEHLVDQPNLRG